MGAILAEGTNVGVAAAVGALDPADIGAPSAASELQPELFDLDGPDGAEGPVTAQLERKGRGRGRPPGSPNKRTEDLRRFVLARYKHPVVALMEIGAMRADELAGYLDCDRLDAIALQVRALAEAAPYVDSKMPMRLQVTEHDRLPSYTLAFGGGGVTIADRAGNTINLTQLAARAKLALDQRLSDGEAMAGTAGSHGEVSHEQVQVIDDVDYSKV